MTHVTVLKLTFLDSEFGEVSELQVHASLESAAMQIEKSKNESDSYHKLVKFDFNEVSVMDLVPTFMAELKKV